MKIIDDKSSFEGARECSSGDYHLGALERVAEQCIECGACLRACGFLRNYGMPGDIAKRILAGDEGFERIAFSCSLCGMCTAVCPAQLCMAEMFLELRRRVVRRREGRFAGHRPLRIYEWIGSSGLMTQYLLPSGCHQVFFPGCTLPGLRPESVLKIVEHLRGKDPSMGVVLQCCNKPSHDLGAQMHFLIEFGRKVDQLLKMGVKHVITACPSCYQVFREYGGGLTTSMIFSHIKDVESDSGPEVEEGCECTVHDACTLRFFPEIQQEVRSIITRSGRRVVEMEHAGATTYCCGEGGAAMMYDPEKTSGWRKLRQAEMKNTETITYCAGCTASLNSANVRHLVDLVFPDPQNMPCQELCRPPKTYFNRLRLKFRLRRLFRG